MANNYQRNPAQREMEQVKKLRKQVQNSFNNKQRKRRCKAILPDGSTCNLPYSLGGRKEVNDQKLNPDLCGYHSMRKSNQERQVANRIVREQNQLLQRLEGNCGLLNNPVVERGKL